MNKKGKSSGYLWVVLLAAVLLGGGIFFFYGTKKKQDTASLDDSTTSVKVGAPSKMKGAPLSVEEESTDTEKMETTFPTPETQSETEPGFQTEENILEFFSYLDGRDYLLHLDPKINTYNRFKEILRRISLHPPVPAGEANHSDIILSNISYFFRTIDFKDIILIKEIIAHEQDSLEMDLQMLFQWVTAGGGPSDLDNLRPSKDVQYRFAGFFMNTIGGKGFLYRRTPKLRLLISYYSLLILYETDRAGQNSYGLDVFPFLRQLKEEITLYSDFQYYDAYINQLDLIETYYLKKR